MVEQWVPIKETCGAYSVSNLGRVRSEDRIVYHRGFPSLRKGKILKAFVVGEKRNYFAVDLFGKTSKVHRLVADAFIPNPENKPQVNHIDGNPMNNKVSNLEWVTCKENIIHAVETGLLVRESAKGCHNTKREVLVFKDGLFVKRLCGSKEMMEFGVNPSKVSACILGKRKTHKGYTYQEW